jgi:hypothetical protein
MIDNHLITNIVYLDGRIPCMIAEVLTQPVIQLLALADVTVYFGVAHHFIIYTRDLTYLPLLNAAQACLMALNLG